MASKFILIDIEQSICYFSKFDYSHYLQTSTIDLLQKSVNALRLEAWGYKNKAHEGGLQNQKNTFAISLMLDRKFPN